jgi:hypothetical protein
MASAPVVLTAPATKLEHAPRPPMASIASGYSKTRDLFRMAGGQSIPVAARFPPEPKPAPKPAAPVAQPQEPPPSGRKAEASIMFSLEELMKSASSNSKPEEAPEEQLWSMQTQSPLFGTSNDQALLTTPLEPAPGSTSMDSMTVSSRRPNGLRLAPLLIGVVGGCTLILAGAGWWMFRGSAEPARAAQVIEAPGPEQPSVPGEAAKPAAAPPAAAVAAVVPDAVPAPPPAADPAVAEPSEPNTALAAAATSPSDKPVSASRAPSSAKKTPPRATKPAVAAQFDKAAAKEALNSAAAKAASCGSGGGAKGKVQLTFANSGKVSSAEITEGPFAGTAAGKCAVRHFKAARIPAFSGPPQTVAKSFKIP